jgi:amino acid transporter
MTASASEERDEPQQRSNFSRALLWRLLAVGLFVTLGTFAVVQSLNKESAPHAHVGHDHDGLVAAVDGVGAKTAELGELGGAVADKTKAGLNNAKSSVSNMASDALASIRTTQPLIHLRSPD